MVRFRTLEQLTPAARLLFIVAMPIEEYVVRQTDGLWEVWIGDQLLSAQPTQMAALNLTEALAHAAAARGSAARILVGSLDGEPLEFPTIEPWGRPSADQT